MAVEEIVIRYKADVSGLEAEINELIAAQNKLTKEVKAGTDEQKKAATTQEFAAKKRTELLKLEEQRLKKLQAAQKLAFDPKEIERFNREIQQSQRNIDTLTGKANQAKGALGGLGDNLIGQFKGVGAAVAAAFSVQAIISFAKQSIDAFLEAEKAAEQLRFAIVSIGGESEEAFGRLIAQSSAVQKISIFGDDQIQQAQSALAAFGLTATQIEDLIPRLADFATVTGTDIASAAQKVGAGLQGAGREFKKLGIEVNANKTELENYTSILNGLAPFTGAAEAATKTLTGQLEQNKQKISDLQEFIGERLAPAFVAAKLVFFEATAALFGFNQELAKQDQEQKNIDKFADRYSKSAERIRKEGGDIIQTFTEASRVSSEVLENNLAKAAEVDAKIKAILDSQAKRTREGADIAGLAQIKNLQEQREKIQNLIDLEKLRKGEIEKQLEIEQQRLRTLTAEDLKGKNLKELEALLKKNGETEDLISKNNIALIEKEIEAQKKLAAENKKLNDERVAALEKVRSELAKLQQQQQQQQIELIEPKSFNEAIDKYNQLADIQKSAVDTEIDNLIKAAKANNTYTAQLGAEFEKIRKFRKDAIDFQKLNQITIFDEQQQEQITASLKAIEDLKFEDALKVKSEDIETNNERVAQSFKELEENLGKFGVQQFKDNLIEGTNLLKASVQERADFEIEKIEQVRDRELALTDDTEVGQAKKAEIISKANRKIIELETDKANQIKQIDADTNAALEESTESLLSKRLKAYEQELQAVSNLLNEIASLSSQLTEKRVNDINTELDAYLDALATQQEANAEDFELRRISEEEFLANEKRINDERVKAEKEAEKKIREEKRKQAVVEKAAALFQIALNTAISLTNPAVALNPLLIALISTLGALQAAAVVAQPIPYRKGSKDTGRQGHLARVGEEGEELVFMPSNSKVLPAKQTRKYGDIIDAMYDNKLDKYIQKNYITPALLAQKQKSEEFKSKSFAENISKSITYNTLGLTPNDLEAQRKRGQYIRNVDEIAAAIAKQLPIKDIYRV
jgi:hypothetical protein